MRLSSPIFLVATLAATSAWAEPPTPTATPSPEAAAPGPATPAGVAPSSDPAAATPPIPQAKFSVKGSLAADEIKKVISAAKDQVSACYALALKTKPNLSGRLAMRWQIDADGAVSTIEVLEGLKHAELDKCLTAAVGSWKFPPPHEGVVSVTYPFNFASRVDRLDLQTAKR